MPVDRATISSLCESLEGMSLNVDAAQAEVDRLQLISDQAAAGLVTAQTNLAAVDASYTSLVDRIETQIHHDGVDERSG